MKIYVTGVFVEDQAQALDFYTGVLGFELKHDIPVGEHRRLTVVEKDNPEGTEFLKARNCYWSRVNTRTVKPFKDALVRDGTPAAPFKVDDLNAEFERVRDLGVEFTQAPMEAGAVKMAVLNDTCGNLIQLVEMTEAR